MTPDVSVVIPVHDRAALLASALQSVRSQLLQPAEVIVVDDGSSDDSAAVAEGFGCTVIRQDQAGVSAARNRGLTAARSARVAFLDSDDEWLPGHLATLARVRPHFPLVSTAAVTTSGALVGSQRTRPLRMHGPDRLIWPDNPVVTSAACVDRRTALDVGGFDPALTHSEDLDLWARLLGRGTGVVLPEVTVRYRLHPGQISVDIEAMRDGADRLRKQGLVSAATARRAQVRDDWDRIRTGSKRTRIRRLLDPRATASLTAVMAHRAGGRIAARRLLPPGA